MSLKIITTEDGSQSLFDEELNETYHSTKGARGESAYVFIEQGLNQLEDGNQSVAILEVGFGTGLNAWLTMKWAEQKALTVHFHTLEPFPIPENIWRNMDLSENPEFAGLHEAEWGKPTAFGDYFHLEKQQTRIEELDAEDHYDVIFFDAFAPSKQPEVWSIENIRRCFSALKPRGILTTYCAQGQFKRDLVEVGFDMEVLPGALGKKEMIRGLKILD